MVTVFDLDDTLFHEMDFVRSAYRLISRIYGLRLLDAMMSAPTPAEAWETTGVPIKELLGIYRTHMPDISLPWQSLYTLAYLYNKGHTIALVTDGRSVTQRNKIRALGLERFIRPELIFISEEIGQGKIAGGAFRQIMHMLPGQYYMYVGDNPEKDFTMPRIYGWKTVCLMNDGGNLRTQDFTVCGKENLPDMTISSLLELIDLVNLKKL